MARRAAVQALYQWQLTHQAPQDIEIHYSLDHELEGIDVAYFHELVSQIPLHQHELDDQLIPHLDRELEDVDPVERAILRIGAYELEFRAEIPYKVVLNETIKLAKTFGAEHGHKYVNAVLDKVASTLRAREIDEERSPSSTTI
jgi:N utilization substance protein B